eukprot:TRINITY_DN2137_c0_g1_i3.p1 TRINITY_DN2137_c0_g1~~TRINITY_DN2137_c0_g1_i3.p1  ORF type:complete len:943 (+),score=259.08 TRINITY_DN2137_c0_g1_i3:156-2984(+)
MCIRDSMNSELLDEPQTKLILKRSMRSGAHYKIVSQHVWGLLHTRYGGGPALMRRGIPDSPYGDTMLEVHLRKFDVFKSSAPDDPAVVLHMSRVTTVQECTEKCALALGVELENVRLWDYFNKDKYQLLSRPEQSVDEANLQDNQDLLLEEKEEDGSWPPEVTYTTSTPAWNALDSPTYSGFRNNSSSPRGAGDNITSRNPIQRGVCGLQNLGNTCFMNSAVSCLLNVPQLVQTFADGSFQQEVNEDNPLGAKGEIAHAFGSLANMVWMSDADVVAPRNFKWTVGQHAPQFRGYDQHDSQELLNFLLDKLHEDLNRIRDKPPTEKIEISDEMPDPEEVAAEAWRRHKLRNDSVIVDNMQAQYKSTIVCPKCQKVYITFDPYMSLTVPLVAEETKTVSFSLALPDRSSRAIRVNVKKEDTILQVLEALVEKAAGDTSLPSDLSPNQLLFTEIWSHKVYKTFSPADEVEDLSDSDTYVVYHVKDQSLFQPRGRTNNYTNPLAHPLTTPDTAPTSIGVIVLHKKPKQSSYMYAQDLYIGTPSLLVFDMPGTNADFLEAVHERVGMSAETHVEYVEPYTARSTPISVVEDNQEEFVTRTNDKLVTVAMLWEHPPPGLTAAGDMVGASSEDSSDPSQGDKSLYDCLGLAGEPEQLTEENAFYCGECKEFVEASKQLEVWSLPKVLLIHLKRFSYTKWSRDKLDDYINFPLEGLDMADYVLSPVDKSQDNIYDLIGISNHHGGLGGGHYTAFVRSLIDKQWYEVDDSLTSKVHHLSSLKSSSAYLLVYVKRSELQKPGWVPSPEGSGDSILGAPTVPLHNNNNNNNNNSNSNNNNSSSRNVECFTLEVTPAAPSHLGGSSISPGKLKDYLRLVQMDGVLWDWMDEEPIVADCTRIVAQVRIDLAKCSLQDVMSKVEEDSSMVASVSLRSYSDVNGYDSPNDTDATNFL